MSQTRTALACAARVSFLLTVVFAGLLPAEVTMITLPGDFADFAIHPKTADIIALSAETDEAFFFRDAHEKATPSAKLRVGSTPCSVCFKQYADQSVFAVVCSQDSHMYLIDSETFDLVKQIELAQAGVSNVTCSINQEDPFIYYNFGGGHGSAAGVVSLRDMRDHGEVFDHSMDCAISADGSIAYRRGPWSPSGFESLARMTKPDEEKPKFARLFYDHNSTLPYVPDPFSRYTAAGKGIYTASLEKRVAEVNFVVQCFFRTQPVVIGVSSAARDLPHKVGESGELVLRAASYNTFADIGDAVVVKLGKAKDDGAVPRGIAGSGDFKRVAKRLRVLADDPRQRVVIASRNQLAYVSLEDFRLPGEPFLLADIQGPQQLEVEKAYELALVPKDDRVAIVLEDAPSGMEYEGGKLRWKPGAEQIGSAVVAVALKHGDIQRTLRYTLEVVYPSISLPLVPAAIVVCPDAKRIVVWEKGHGDRFGQLSMDNGTLATMAVVELDTGKVIAKRELAKPIRAAAVTENSVVVQTADSNAKCDVLRIDDLELKKSIVTSAPIWNCRVVGKLLLLETSGGTEVYDAETFDRLGPSATQSLGPVFPAGVEQGDIDVVKKDGLLLGGMLYDFNMKPVLFVAPTAGMFELPGGDASMKKGGFLPSAETGDKPRRRRDREVPSEVLMREPGSTRHATMQLPGSDVRISLERSVEQIRVPGATHTTRAQLTLALAALGGSVNARQVIVRRVLYDHPRELAFVLQVAKSEALVAFGTELYRWHVDLPMETAAAQDHKPRLIPSQSTMVLSGEGTTVLEHAVEGGDKPVKFELLTSYDGALSIDAATGRVTVDEKRLLVEATKALEAEVMRRTSRTSMTESLRSMAPRMVEAAVPILGRRPKGAPVAVPVRVAVDDGLLAGSAIQYYVLAEVPSAPLMNRMKQLDQQRQEEQAVLAARKEMERAASESQTTGDAEGSQTELQKVVRRLETVEQRLDRISECLEEVLKKLDKEK